MHGITDFIDVSGSDTLLAVGKPSAGRVLRALEIGNQRMHSGGGKETCRVIFRNKRGALYFGMSMFFEKLNVFAAQF
jgi:hypothetical protein